MHCVAGRGRIGPPELSKGNAMAQTTRPHYFALVVRDHASGPWVIEFGAFDRTTVLHEQADWLDHFDDQGHRRQRSNCQVITTGPTTQDVDDAVAKLNAQSSEQN